jgi:hypothetical protein
MHWLLSLMTVPSLFVFTALVKQVTANLTYLSSFLNKFALSNLLSFIQLTSTLLLYRLLSGSWELLFEKLINFVHQVAD